MIGIFGERLDGARKGCEPGRKHADALYAVTWALFRNGFQREEQEENDN